jgi:prolyl-tRNA synthetase
MRYSRVLGKTMREAPRGVDGPASLLLRAGLLRSPAPGVFTLLPLGKRVAANVSRMVAEEFARAGAQPIETPPYAPTFRERGPLAELKRALADCRPEMRQQYFLAVSHEETLAALAGSLALSHRELPLLVAGEQWKYRDENTAASLTCARWFSMYGAYAFDADEESAASSRGLFAGACRAAFERMGMDAVAMGDDIAVYSDSGDEPALACDSCGYAALEADAESLFAPFSQDEAPLPQQAIFGPNLIGTAELAAFAGIDPRKTTKTLLFQAGRRVIAACVRGEFGVSEAKLARLAGCSSLELAAPETIREMTGAEVGYAGPLGLPKEVEIFWDRSMEGRINFEAGANRTDYHLLNLNFGRDVPLPERFVDIRQARQGEQCARCGAGRLQARRVLRIANVSTPGTIYSKALGAMYAGRDGRSAPVQITVSGIEMTRLMAAVAERHSDARGFAWPRGLAPFTAHLVSLGNAEDRARALYDCLRDAGVEVLWDDRQGGAGAKFGDADLIGIPVRLIVSPKTGDNVEWKERGADAAEMISAEEVASRLLATQGRA